MNKGLTPDVLNTLNRLARDVDWTNPQLDGFARYAARNPVKATAMFTQMLVAMASCEHCIAGPVSNEGIPCLYTDE